MAALHASFFILVKYTLWTIFIANENYFMIKFSTRNNVGVCNFKKHFYTKVIYTQRMIDDM